MNDALSIFAAARDAPDAIGLVIGARRYRFAELAQLARARMETLRSEVQPGLPLPILATGTLATVVTLYAALELRIPFLPLHPRLPALERDAQVRAATQEPLAHDDVAAIVFTSGTTGMPRGAILGRAALLASAQASAANLGWQSDDNWLLCMSLARIGGLSIVTRCLIARRAFTLVDIFRAEQLPELIDAHRITLLSVVPTMLTLLLDARPDWRPPPWLRTVQLGGAAASDKLLQRAAERGLPIMITYGMTETCSQIVATPYDMRWRAAEGGAGRPLADAQLRVVDGRIQMRGPMRMHGYLGEAPLATDAWFDTGDLGEVDAQGALQVHARSAEVIVTGGDKVFPVQIERALEAMAGVREAGVFGVPDETWGQIVAAALVVGEGAPTEAEVRAHFESRLAPHMRPRRLFLVAQLPHTPAGKIDRPALLRELFERPAERRALPR